MSEDSRDDGGMAGRPSHGRRFFGVRPGLWLLAVAVLAGGVLFSLWEGLVFADEGQSGKGVYASILIGQRQPHLLREGSGAGDEAPDFDQFRRTQAALIKSRFILNNALNRPEVAALGTIKAQGDPLAWLEKTIRIDSSETAEILRVSLPGVAAADAAALINAVVEAYLREFVNIEKSRRLGRRDALDRLYKQYQDGLKSKRKALRALAEFVDGAQDAAPEIQRKLDQEEIADCRRDLHRIKLDRAAAEARLARRKEAKGSGPEDLAAIARLEEDVAVLAEQAKVLNEDMATLEAQLTHATRRETRQTLDLQSLQDEIDLASEAARKIGAESESLKVELNAPDRIRLLERAEAPGR